MFESIIVRARLTELPMPCLNTLSVVLRKKRPFEQKTSQSCTACSLLWPMPASQTSASQPSCRHSTKFLSVKLTSYYSFDNLVVTSEIKYLLMVLMPAFEIWYYNFMNCRTTTKTQKCWELVIFRSAEKTLRESSNTKGFHMSQKSSAIR